MSKRDLGGQREDRILVAEEEILHEMKPSHEKVLGVLQITWVILPFFNTYYLRLKYGHNFQNHTVFNTILITSTTSSLWNLY
jgi:hypothetical protein